MLRARLTPRPLTPDSLPTREDANADGMIWIFRRGDRIYSPAWYLRHWDSQRWSWETHWLPGDALPVPEKPESAEKRLLMRGIVSIDGYGEQEGGAE
jgi:hypothetical protein